MTVSSGNGTPGLPDKNRVMVWADVGAGAAYPTSQLWVDVTQVQSIRPTSTGSMLGLVGGRDIATPMSPTVALEFIVDKVGAAFRDES